MATTEKMLPAGMIPGKTEIEKYKALYRNQDFSLLPMIENFDYQTLPEEYILTFCKRYPYETGVACKDPAPLKCRWNYINIKYDWAKREFLMAEARFRKVETEAAYKTLRIRFSATIGAWVCLGYMGNAICTERD